MLSLGLNLSSLAVMGGARNRWGIFDNRSQVPFQTQSQQYHVSVHERTAHHAVERLLILMPFWYIGGDVETNIAAGGVLNGWVEYPALTSTPILVGGSADIPVVPGDTAAAIVNVRLPSAGSRYRMHFKWAMETTNCVPVSTHTSGVSGDDGFITNATLAQDYVPGNALVTTSNLGYAPMVLGEANWADEPSVVGLGDSILYGQGPRAAGASGDDDFGNWSWLEKMLFANSIPYWGMARGSAQATVLWNSGNHRLAKRIALLSRIGNKPMLVDALGRNDLGSSIHLSSTNSIHGLLRPYFRKIAKSTVMPWTTPNPFPAGGTGQADASSGNVAAWNALVRAKSSFPEVDGVVDVNAMISALYTGGSEALWDVSGGDPTSDATHPNALGDTLARTRLDTDTDGFAGVLAEADWPGY